VKQLNEVLCQVWDRTDAKREKKVVVLMELHRAIIYTTKMSKQVTKSQVRNTVHIYPVKWGAGLTVSKGSVRGTKEQRFYSCLDCLTLCNIRRALGSKCCSADGVVLSTN
jgi:hypothetical protein